MSQPIPDYYDEHQRMAGHGGVAGDEQPPTYDSAPASTTASAKGKDKKRKGPTTTGRRGVINAMADEKGIRQSDSVTARLMYYCLEPWAVARRTGSVRGVKLIAAPWIVSHRQRKATRAAAAQALAEKAPTTPAPAKPPATKAPAAKAPAEQAPDAQFLAALISAAENVVVPGQTISAKPHKLASSRRSIPRVSVLKGSGSSPDTFVVCATRDKTYIYKSPGTTMNSSRLPVICK